MTSVFCKRFARIILFSILVFTNTETICQSQPDSVKQSRIDSVKKSVPKIKNNHKEKNESGFYIYSDSGKSNLKIYGEIRVNSAFDINGLQAQETFNVYDIPTDSSNSNDPRFYIGVFQSRFGMEAKIKINKDELFAKLEGDFLGSNNNFRIRQAYAKFGSFLIGKTRSLFGDPDAIPDKVDREGPNFALSERTIQFRFEPGKKNNLKWGAAIENPEPNITNSDSAEVSPYYQSIPEITSFIKHESQNGGHLQLAGIFRNITVRNLNEKLQIIQGYGALFSGSINFLDKKKFMFQIYGGRAMAKYVKTFKGEGLDIIFDNIQNVYKPVYLYGGFISMYHQWTNKVFSDFTAGYSDIKNIQSQPGDSFNKGFYGSVNLFFRTFQGSEAGIEYSFGKLKTIDSQTGTANRISFITFFYF